MRFEKNLLVANCGEDSLYLFTKDLSVLEIIELKDFSQEFIDDRFGPFDLLYLYNNLVLCSNSINNSLMKIDIKDKLLLGFIKLGKSPTKMIGYKDKVYILTQDTNSIYVVDVKEFVVIEIISVGDNPTDISLNLERKLIYVANSNNNYISVFGMEDRSYFKIKFKSYPKNIVYSDGKIYVLSLANNGTINNSILYIVDSNDYKILLEYNFNFSMNSMLLVEEKNCIFFISIDNNKLFRLDLKDNKLNKICRLPGMPGLLLNYNDTLLISDIKNNIINILDINSYKTMWNLFVGKEPQAIILY